MPRLEEIAGFLRGLLETDRYPSDPPLIYHEVPGTISRLGLALEPWPQMADWVEQNDLDGVFLHRPFELTPDALGREIAVLAAHLSFDEHLALGCNKVLAAGLSMKNVWTFGKKEGRPLGMIGDVTPVSFDDFLSSLNTLFGGFEEASGRGGEEVRRIAVVGAISDALVRGASAAGAQVYVTGQLRAPGRVAVQETKIAAVAVGHRRSEEWGLRKLAQLLEENWPGTELSVFPRTFVMSPQTDSAR